MDKCRCVTDHVIDEIFDAAGEDPLPLAAQLRIGIHLFFCSRCAGEMRRLETLRDSMASDFLPPFPEFEEMVMEKISAEADGEGEAADAPAGFSFRGWIIIGCFVLLSLSTVFFGMDFIKVANAQGSSFLLPIGLTIGAVLTGYGAFFIGSHLKQLRDRFGLR